MAHHLGSLAYRMPRTRQSIEQHLGFALGDVFSQRQIERITQQNFVHMAEALTELLWWMNKPASSLRHYITCEGDEHIREALKAGKGVIGITSHLGNWELLGGYVSNFIVPISVIAEPAFDARVNQILIDARTHLGVSTIYRRESGRGILRVLRSGGFLGMLADQDIPSSESVFVEFFGHPAYTPVGPAAISLKTGAALVPMFIRRLPNGHHRVEIDPQIEFTPSGDYPRDVHDLTQLWSRVVERHIQATPEQWVWLHNRYATKPTQGAQP